MYIEKTNYTVADYCAGMLRKEIIVNRQYQRSDKVWPPAARSFLIETILLNYPMPKLSLYQITDIKSRKTIKEIVDGQQRSQTILDFYKDKLRLPKSSEIPDAAGKLYSQLDPEHQHDFLNYSLSVDLFVGATPDEIREIFRRINSYTVPLNPEEQRHSMYQGTFKWFIYRMSKKYDQNLIDLGVFGEKQLVRMADAKIFSEITHSFLFGITTTDKKILAKLYKDYDLEFAREKEIETRIEETMDLIIGLEEIHKGPLMRPYNLYSLILAISHVMNPVVELRRDYESSVPYVYEREAVVSNLTALSESLQDPENPGIFSEFVSANLSKTNVADQRKKRFKWFCKALQPVLF